MIDVVWQGKENSQVLAKPFCHPMSLAFTLFVEVSLNSAMFYILVGNRDSIVIVWNEI